jgi:hypothetical protein
MLISLALAAQKIASLLQRESARTTKRRMQSFLDRTMQQANSAQHCLTSEDQVRGGFTHQIFGGRRRNEAQQCLCDSMCNTLLVTFAEGKLL